MVILGLKKEVRELRRRLTEAHESETTHILTAKELQETNQALYAVIQASPIPIVALEPDGRVTMWSSAATRVFGWSEGEAINRILPFVPEEKMEEFEELRNRVLAGHDLVGKEVTRRRKDGSLIEISISTAPLRDHNGEIHGIVALLEDLTERKRMEEERLRTHKLESIGVLAGGIAHDFNNTLTSLLSNITLAKMEVSEGSEIFEKLVEAETDLFRMKEISNQLLTFSKGGSPIKKVLSLGELIRKSAEFSLAGSNVKCHFSLPENLWLVKGDKGQIWQVIQNLIINSCEAMPQGGTIKVSCENVPSGTSNEFPWKTCNYVKISIEDNGVGIPKEDLPKVFDPFFSTKKNRRGFGLATSYSIVKNHDGCILAESDPSVRTSFQIYLPATEEKETATPVETESPSLSTVTHRKRILLVDDNEPLRGSVKLLLRMRGFNVQDASEGAEAVRLYRKAKIAGSPFDAVILDIAVSEGMGAKEAIRRLLKIDPNVRAIVSSGYFDDPVMTDPGKSGIRGILPKPYGIKELIDALNSALSH
jgi:PAS domain S-box-containing protein